MKRPSPARALGIALALTTALASAPSTADPEGVAGTLAPSILPTLALGGPRLDEEVTAAFTRPSPEAGEGGTSLALVHARFEMPLSSHVLSAGAAMEAGAAASAGRGRATVIGSPELWLRAAFPATGRLAAGGALGVVLPLPGGDSPAKEAARGAARAVRSWDAVRFEDASLSLRPALDLGLVAGPLLLQLRQGLDLVFATRSVRAGEPAAALVARAGLYAGYQTGPAALGLELWEVYALTADVDDADRATVTLTPALRLRFARVEPTLSLSFPLHGPTAYVSASFGAAFRL